MGIFNNSTVHSAIDFRIAEWAVNIFHEVSQLKNALSNSTAERMIFKLTNQRTNEATFHKRAFKEDIYERYFAPSVVTPMGL